MSSYIPILVMIVASALLAGGMVAGSFFLGPRKPSSYKATSYECGMTPVGSARERFPIKFYLIAMLFIVFDIETIFLYPWAVTYHALPYATRVFNFGEMLVFVIILFVGYGYVWGKGALDWDDSEQARTGDVVTPEALAPRRSLRYGNEHSGPVALPSTLMEDRAPSYGAASQEEAQALSGIGRKG